MKRFFLLQTLFNIFLQVEIECISAFQGLFADLHCVLKFLQAGGWHWIFLFQPHQNLGKLYKSIS